MGEPSRPPKYFLFGPMLLVFLLLTAFSLTSRTTGPAGQEASQQPERGASLLKLLGIAASPESIDYVQNRTQFQLHNLLTEQRHPKTWNLSEVLHKDVAAGLRMLFSVDEDIVKRLETLGAQRENLEQATGAIQAALLAGNKIYVYGCGATGRLAKQMESSFWRPFWREVKANEKIWAKLRLHLSENIEEMLVGEMTGADRALISSLEGFEDLQLIGRLQLADRKIKKGDVVICVTEGGETSSVIGTILAALDQWKGEKDYDPMKSRQNLYFVYNNPDDRLTPLARSRKVIEEPGITKINLTTGPQAIAGSTRMQATTIETFVIGNILEVAISNVLKSLLSAKEMARLNCTDTRPLEEKLGDFAAVLKEVESNVPAIARFTELEAQTYSADHFSTYFAQKAMITVFIDSTERSPTFRLYPLDTNREPKRKCWIQVWTPAANLDQAWLTLLGRPFKGISPDFYRKPFEEEIGDPFLQAKALESLGKAGDDQKFLYDFSWGDFNLKNRGPQKGDLGVLVIISPEEEELRDVDSGFRKFVRLFSKNGAKLVLALFTDKPAKEMEPLLSALPANRIVLNVAGHGDPFGLRQQVALKIILNAHSTAVMTKLGRVIGNTMTNVSPSNLKLIGRATYLIQSHVNGVLSAPQWVRTHGLRKPISYGEANAVLFESMAFLKDKAAKGAQAAEVALSIIRILEALRLNAPTPSQDALAILQKPGLAQYLANLVSGEH